MRACTSAGTLKASRSIAPTTADQASYGSTQTPPLDRINQRRQLRSLCVCVCVPQCARVSDCRTYCSHAWFPPLRCLYSEPYFRCAVLPFSNQIPLSKTSVRKFRSVRAWNDKNLPLPFVRWNRIHFYFLRCSVISQPISDVHSNA